MVHRVIEHGIHRAFGPEHPGADFGVVGAQEQDCVVEFSRHCERPPLVAFDEERVDRAGLWTLGGFLP